MQEFSAGRYLKTSQQGTLPSWKKIKKVTRTFFNIILIFLEIDYFTNPLLKKKKIILACVSVEGDVLNALHSVDGSTKTITLRFGLYINWGRPNKNTSRINELIQLLTSGGCSVQLQFDDSFEAGVEVLCDGESVYKKDDYQHNKNYRRLSEQAAEAAGAALK